VFLAKACVALNTKTIHCKFLGSVGTISFVGLYKWFIEDFTKPFVEPNDLRMAIFPIQWGIFFSGKSNIEELYMQYLSYKELCFQVLLGLSSGD